MASGILVVDDAVNMRELVAKALSIAGHQVTTVPSAEQAREMLLQKSFGLIILDIDLGSESGLSLLKEFKDKGLRTPVVIYSGSVTPEVETEARAAGAADVLRKDIGIETLVTQIGRIVQVKDRISDGISVRKETPILLVDDQDNIRAMLKTFFERKGFKIVEATNGQQAVEIVRSQKVSAVLLDMEMPGMTGLETLPKLLEINPRLGVLMATGVQDNDMVRQAIAIGAYGYVLKPFDFLYLEMVVMSRLAIAAG